MKNPLLIIFILGISFNTFGQESDDINTLFSENIKVSGFGGPLMSYGTINNEFSYEMGGGGGVLLNDQFFIGGFGMGLTNTIDFSEAEYQGLDLELGYGGLWFGYILNGRAAFHPVISTQIGWGEAMFTEAFQPASVRENIFVLNPALELEMNITRFMRFAVGGNYRKVIGTDFAGLSDADFSGPGVFMSFRFGWF